MIEADLLYQLAQGEDSRHQFKRDATNADALAAELAAFANSGGGTLFIGVNDDASVAGLNAAAVRQGKTNRRNPTLTEHAFKVLPYRGLGSGIPRALQEWPRIDLIDDIRGNQFSVVVRRPEAEWVSTADQVTGEVARLLGVLQGEMKRTDLQEALGLKHEDHFRDAYLKPALDRGLIEMTLPEKPRSRMQKYRLTASGRTLLKSLRQEPPMP